MTRARIFVSFRLVSFGLVWIFWLEMFCI
jgi:hypothetical protein